jgi:hypothetical protein
MYLAHVSPEVEESCLDFLAVVTQFWTLVGNIARIVVFYLRHEEIRDVCCCGQHIAFRCLQHYTPPDGGKRDDDW